MYKIIIMALLSICLLEAKQMGTLDIKRICSDGYEFLIVKNSGGMTADDIEVIQVDIRRGAAPKECRCP